MTRAPHEMVDRYFSESEGVRLPVRVRAPTPRSNPHRGHRVPAPPPPSRRDRGGTLVPDRCGPPVWQRRTKAEGDSSTRVRRGDVASRAKPSCTVGALTRADLWRRRVAPSPSWFEVAQLELPLRSMDFSPSGPSSVVTSGARRLSQRGLCQLCEASGRNQSAGGRTRRNRGQTVARAAGSRSASRCISRACWVVRHCRWGN